MQVYRTNTSVTFTVWDWNRITPPEHLGEVSVSLDHLSPGSHTLQEQLHEGDNTNNKVASGYLFCRYMYHQPPAGALVPMCKLKIAQGSFGKFCIRIIECKGLRAADTKLLKVNTSDPFVQVPSLPKNLLPLFLPVPMPLSMLLLSPCLLLLPIPCMCLCQAFFSAACILPRGRVPACLF